MSFYERECLVTIWAILHFKDYLYCKMFTLIINQQPLKWLMELEKLVGKFASWALMLQKYDFQVVRCASLVNWNVGGLSLDPSTSQQNGTRGGWWHDKISEEMVLCWHAFAFLCIFVKEAYITSLAEINMLAQTSWALKMCMKMHQYWICQPNLLMGKKGYVKFEAQPKKMRTNET